MRDTPIITFINKLDRESRAPIELLDEIETTLGMECAPITWPIGMGKTFRGVYHLYNDEISFFDPRAEKGTSEVIKGLDNPRLDEVLGHQVEDLRLDIELVRGASHTFDKERYLSGKQTPVFFGSAINNFGVQSLLDAVVELSPPPQARNTASRPVAPDEGKFSGFVFKIQANMDPKHRDRIAFLRVCSGRFERGMKIKQVASGKTLSVNNAITFMAQDRTTMDEAYSGDIIGIPNHGTVKLGDTFTEGENIKFTGIPSFAPEFFRRARIKNPMKMKQLQIGLKQLAEEGAAQLFRPLLSNDLILGAVGMLQFEVVAHRLEHEYGVDMVFEPYDCYTARWLHGKDADLKAIADKYGFNVALDGADDYVYLAPNRVNLQMAQERYPDIEFKETREIA
jgi:peptide chain release factor 3